VTKKTKKADDDEFQLDEVLGVWMDLERALEGKNGFGGTVAEIYAYRLIPVRHRDHYVEGVGTVAAEDPWPLAKQAEVAGRNMTRLLRHFVELHEGVEVAIEELSELSESGVWVFRKIDPHEEDFPAFDHRVHLRVSRSSMIRRQIASELLGLWSRACEEQRQPTDAGWPEPDFTAWSGTTKDLLMALGLEWDPKDEKYVLKKRTGRE
jgi:hypothetical protein